MHQAIKESVLHALFQRFIALLIMCWQIIWCSFQSGCRSNYTKL